MDVKDVLRFNFSVHCSSTNKKATNNLYDLCLFDFATLPISYGVSKLMAFLYVTDTGKDRLASKLRSRIFFENFLKMYGDTCYS